MDLEQTTIATDAELCTVLGLDGDEFAGWPETAQELAQDVVDRAVREDARAGSIAAPETADAVARYTTTTGDDATLANPQEVAQARAAAAHAGYSAHGRARHLSYRGPRDHRTHDQEAPRA